jgi:hypothetical protein
MPQPLDMRTRAWLDQEDRRTSAIIREHRVYIESILGGPAARPPFAYTVGLFGMAHPELLIVGLCHHESGAILNEIAGRVIAGHDFIPNETVSLPGWDHHFVTESIPNPAEIVFAANRFYQRPDAASVPVLQLTYPDEAGRFPWDEGYSLPAWRQPRPGAFRA